MSRVTFVWTGAEQAALEPLLVIDQFQGATLLPGPRPTTVRDHPAYLRLTPFSYHDAAGDARQGQEVKVWWVEDGRGLSVMSRALPPAEVLRVAESLAPGPPPVPAHFRSAVTAGRDGRYVVAGRVDDFPVPSITQLTDVKLYLVRTEAGLHALVDDEPHLHHPTGWSEAEQLFHSPAHGELYDWQGNCLGGPCPRGLDRHPVVVRDGLVLIDTQTRLPGLAPQPAPYLSPGPRWP